MLFLDHDIMFYFLIAWKKFKKKFKLFLNTFENMKMEHLLQKSKCSIFHNILKYMVFQMCQKALLWSKGLSSKAKTAQMYSSMYFAGCDQEVGVLNNL